jgi:hypothetical protein
MRIWHAFPSSSSSPRLENRANVKLRNGCYPRASVPRSIFVCHNYNVLSINLGNKQRRASRSSRFIAVHRTLVLAMRKKRRGTELVWSGGKQECPCPRLGSSRPQPVNIQTEQVWYSRKYSELRVLQQGNVFLKPLSETSLHQWYSTFFVLVPSDVISLQLLPLPQSCWCIIQVIHSL